MRWPEPNRLRRVTTPRCHPPAAYLHKLEHYVRADLEQHAPRRFGVQDTLKLVLTNLPADFTRTVEARHFPGRADDESTYTMPITRCVAAVSADPRGLGSA